MVGCFSVAPNAEGQKSYMSYQNDTLKKNQGWSRGCVRKEVRWIRNRMEYIQSVKGWSVLWRQSKILLASTSSTLSLIHFFSISWRLTTLQYCSGFCHTLKWISHGFTCVPPPNPPSLLPLHLIPLGLPSAPGLSTCLMHPTWAGDLFHPW